MTNNWNFDNLEIRDFVPTKLTDDDCRHRNKNIVTRAGRIEYSECLDCKQKVWG